MKYLLLSNSESISEIVNSDISSSNAANNMSTNDIISSFLEKVIHWCQTSGIKLLFGLIALFILFKIINAIAKKIRNKMLKKGRDETITNVMYEIVRKGLKILLFILFLGYVGIDTAGIGSIIASAAVAVGLALQGSLSNIAGWVIIIVMRPFKFNDYIACQGVDGTVEDIKLFYTYLRTPDNKVVMIPNGSLANGNIINYSTKKTRRLDQVWQISYGDDVVKAIMLIEEVISKHKEVLLDPAPFVRMSQCDSSSINITSRVWVKQEDYWNLHFDLIKEVKDIFDVNGITVPYNQLDVHISKE